MRSGRWGVSFTSEETNPVAEAARLAGGYDQILRLERERRAIMRRGQVSRVVRADDGSYSCQAVHDDAPLEPTGSPSR